MPLLQFRDVTLSYGGEHLLSQANFQIDAGERVCLLGRNGSGKTSLMRLLTGAESPSEGEIIRSTNLRAAMLPQEIPTGLTGRVADLIHTTDSHLHTEEEWERDLRLEALLEAMKLSPDTRFEQLSGGLQRRVLLARTLAGKPDLLMLDEPTNHLDLDSILWLESFLLAQPVTLFFVTHDRAFLRKLATRILDLDRGQLTSWDCDYATYLERKNAWLEAEEKQWATQDKKLAEEESWIRQGVKARRTRDQGRVAALQKLRAERGQRRERSGQAQIEIQTGTNSGVKVIEAEAVSFAYSPGQPVVQELSTTIFRGDKIGIIGPNGSGKSTLLKLLLGELQPDTGEVRTGANLQTLYLDQLRGQINPDKTLIDNVAGGAEQVSLGGRSRHVIGYLQDFLFSPAKARMPARLLSGGEKNRLLLAKLFLQPANTIVLDEPTNDLDLETLELLEQLLVDYDGTLLLVSHDREFLDRVVTGSLVFEAPGQVREYVGGYEDWLQQRPAPQSPPPQIEAVESSTAKPKRKSERPRKFRNREQRELEELPGQLEQLEQDHVKLAERLADPKTYQETPDEIPKLQEASRTIESQMEIAFARWEELEALKKELHP